ncbi:MAG: helix-turn-helix domain-containing protein [Flavonifractor plautii]
MELFAEKGYEDTSMADIARRMGVVQGLCYRYFDSKRVLFREAMEQYVRECCAAGSPIIHDRSRTIRQLAGRHGGADAGDRAERPLPRLLPPAGEPEHP